MNAFFSTPLRLQDQKPFSVHSHEKNKYIFNKAVAVVKYQRVDVRGIKTSSLVYIIPFLFSSRISEFQQATKLQLKRTFPSFPCS